MPDTPTTPREKEGHTWGDIRPVPDPTSLTSAALQEGIKGLRDVIETRLAGMDKAIDLLQASTDRLPAEVAARIETLKELHEEKFLSVQRQFEERDTRTNQAATAAKEALSAALAAAKEAVAAALQAAKEAVSSQNESFSTAVAKSEMTTTKQIDGLGELLRTAVQSLESKIGDLKDRLTTIEGRTSGATTQQVTQQAGAGQWISVGSLVVALIAVVVAVVMAVVKR